MGDFSDHLHMLKKKADDFSRRILSPRLTETDVAIFHRSIYIPSMRYSLAAIAVDEESLASVQTNVIKSMLQKFHLSSTIPTSLRHGPIELGGMGLYDLRTEAGIEAIKFLRNSSYSDSEAGNLIRLNLQYSQREAGVGFYLLEEPRKYLSYLTPSWILSIRQYLANHNMSIKVSDIHNDQLQGPTDEYIMNASHLQRYSPAQQLDQRFLVLSPLHSILQEYPGLKNFTIGTSHETSTPINDMESFDDYLSTVLSRTERRLLDGLEQMTSDIQIWRAFRSKARLYLASDGGLGETSASHGWVLSSGKEVLYQCSRSLSGLRQYFVRTGHKKILLCKVIVTRLDLCGPRPR